ncbi:MULTISPECIES: cytochrome d ubiquinol oxidase subunit II [Halolamina]|uniref:Cytochrome d ubiquinol oxidase subunit II n=1 Tax=Halolamina pelagica TaxID=699431 RepID=A0A1I5P849_9EURY|nr:MULTISPECIES: cytochrome d ubiquinol oxidase subunit II [Halolamina]NHX36682.1 cytochrome d ubiquinol oxidase subunit II [Halolamina sp. R1-12]SFP30252.1 cytochrome d ubiquinol oxidase subunit II [Halolamina pelagica]
MTDLAGEALFGLPLPEIWFGLVFFVLGMFLFLDGFDFGIGILFATREDAEEKETLLAAIGPFWDGNEVWLVVFGGALFAAFPEVYANLFSRYYLLMFAILAALGLRGLSPEMYEEREDDQWRRYWGYAFVVGSALTPFLLGVFAINWLTGVAGIVSVPGVLGGLAVVALTVADGAAFLGLKTRGSLRDDASRYGTRAAVAYLGLVALTLVAVYVTTPALQSALLSLPVIALVLLSVALVAGYVVATRRGEYLAAFASVGGLVFGLVTVIAVTMFPAVDRATGLSVSEGIVSTLPLNLMTIMMALLLPIVLSYFGVLYSVFSGPIESGETYG